MQKIDVTDLVTGDIIKVVNLIKKNEYYAEYLSTHSIKNDRLKVIGIYYPGKFDTYETYSFDLRYMPDNIKNIEIYILNSKEIEEYKQNLIFLKEREYHRTFNVNDIVVLTYISSYNSILFKAYGLFQELTENSIKSQKFIWRNSFIDNIDSYGLSNFKEYSDWALMGSHVTLRKANKEESEFYKKIWEESKQFI